MSDTWQARFTFEDIVGVTPTLRQALQLAHQAADAGYPTILVGESGTGKELFAHAIHNASVRRNGPFVPVNCGTLIGELAVAGMCGYEPGSFTGADRHTHEGVLDTADHGTLFLDELQDIPPIAQTVLLRFLETGRFIRVGGTQPVHTSARVIAASNVAIDELEQRRLVRTDLLYRLNCLTIEIPPLRERCEDIRPIAEKCLREEIEYAGEVDEEVWRALATCRYAWPGNARGLRNILLKAILGCSNGRLTVADLPQALWLPTVTQRASPALEPAALKIKRVAAKAVLDAAGGNVSEAARRLGVHRSTIYRRLGQSR